ncbi:MAG: bifunctional ADP-dependent (S)-NAD(P)H-hydrate dehydratase/NAD(P)H-hydrate epimerase [Sphingomonas bacterium]|uniref:NAD(P)H-hydrate dehydratase n=1 Tax=Sphingomonas bacterium TaxID=1895847 RepID=UPI0026159F0E|nr:NAD(P)H-hydrate dehydratase [Sphingomonas bacterium]MDB5709549.1 bifunctional ADP-dependent (S)-NAD(P)H-hydrate dehydratase/NAD(P)H-hydrate epimerase [Sphingomonas bacterium]
MTPIDGAMILTSAEMRAAESAAIAEGETVDSLMTRAGEGVASAVRRLAAGSPILIVCGPGNNGGDGYVAARTLRAAGLEVSVAAVGEPQSEAAARARSAWTGEVSSIETAQSAPIVVDALFGTGLTRPIAPDLRHQMMRLAGYAKLSVAVDVPSGVETDTGANLGAMPVHLTLALGAMKPAHVLYPAAAIAGTVRLISLGLRTESRARALYRPGAFVPTDSTHKYGRGMVAIIGGSMPGAAVLAAEAAMRAGAGYALLLTDQTACDGPSAVVGKAWSVDTLADKRIGAVLIGPGLGRDLRAKQCLDAALASGHMLVIDGDALHLLAGARLERLRERGDAVLTPHAGEFEVLFGAPAGSKIDATRDAARRSGSHVVFKGADTVISTPNEDVVVASRANPWLSTAGTGDVLAGAIGAMVAGPIDPAWSVPAGVWLHQEAARRLGGAFIADDLAFALTAARAAL